MRTIPTFHELNSYDLPIDDARLDQCHGEFRARWQREGLSSDVFSHDLTLLRRLHQSLAHLIEESTVRIVRDSVGVVAILPLYTLKPYRMTDVSPIPVQLLGEDTLINFHPMILPARYLQVMTSKVPHYITADISPSYTELVHYEDSTLTCTFPYSVIEPAPLHRFLDKMERKERKEAERLLRKFDGSFQRGLGERLPTGYQALFDQQEQYRVERDTAHNNRLVIDSWRELHSPELWAEHQRIIAQRAEELGVLRVISAWDNGELIAANLSIYEGDVYTDYITIRSQDPKYKPYSLGIVMILHNVDWAHQMGCKVYDMGPTDATMAYKRKFPSKPVRILGFMKAGLHDLIEHELLGNLRCPLVYGGYVLENEEDVQLILRNTLPGRRAELESECARLEPKYAQALKWRSVINELESM